METPFIESRRLCQISGRDPDFARPLGVKRFCQNSDHTPSRIVISSSLGPLLDSANAVRGPPITLDFDRCLSSDRTPARR